MDSVRVYLVLFLAAQFLVPLVPSWGAFVPHDHWARAPITAADWDAHIREHLTGHVANFLPNAPSDEPQIVSIWSHNGLSSFQAPLANHETVLDVVVAPHVVLATLSARPFTARVLAYPPLNPPPTG